MGTQYKMNAITGELDLVENLDEINAALEKGILKSVDISGENMIFTFNTTDLAPVTVPLSHFATNLQGHAYIGLATPSTTPVTLKGNEKVFYIATEGGDYSNFGLGNINELSIIKSENGNWSVETSRLNFLSLKGGTMKGTIDMNGKRIDNIGIEEVNSLPTANLYEGRMVRFKNKTYTFYNGLWLALSDDLRGRANDTHEENFVYQPTASDLSIKDGFADIKKLKGNTLVWNQSDRTKGGTTTADGLTFSWNNGVLTINGTATADSTFYGVSHGYKSIIKNIKAYRYLSVSGDFTGSDNSFVTHSLDFELQYLKLFFNSTTKVTKNIFSAMNYTYFAIRYSIGDIFSNVKIQSKLIDLTQMFGEGNEPTTVEEFEAMFPNDYYEYNEGELMSFDGKGLKSVGFNAFDGEKAKVLKGQRYYLGGAYTALGFKENENSETIAFELPSDRYYTPTSNGYIVATGENICINLSHSGYRDGEYVPYEDYTLSFQDGKTISQLTGKLNGEGESVTIFPDALRSAGEAFDEIVYDEATGKHKAIKRIGSVDMGILSYMYNTDKSVFYTPSITSIPKIKTNGAVISVKYPQYTGSITEMLDKKISTSNYHYNNAVIIKDTSYTDVDSFKASLQGQILYYELETPEVYELDFPINTSYEAYDFGTEEVLYNNDKEVNIPMKANIEYGFNAVDMIRNNFEVIRTLKERVTALEQAILQIQTANIAIE